MIREIGSNFELNPENSYKPINLSPSITKFDLKGDDYTFLSTGRSAIKYVLVDIEKNRKTKNYIALLPSFTCETVLTPFKKCGYIIKTYSVNLDLNVNLKTFRNELETSNATVVLIHRYFGFNTFKGFESIISDYEKKGVIFIEDVTQSLLSSFPKFEVPYTIGSIRKWGGFPDGAFAIKKNGKFDYKPDKSDEELENLKLIASFAKYTYLNQRIGNKSNYLDIYKKAEIHLNKQNGFYKISDSSISILENIDLEDVKHRRIDNYNLLYENLQYNKKFDILLPPLTDEDVPLYFVVTTTKRNLLQNILKNHDIYAPIIWPKSNMISISCKNSISIYNSVLAIPCDQRYAVDDMKRIITIINEEF